MAGAEAVAEALAESVQQIVALSPDRVAEDGPEAFDPFRRAVTQASRGRDAPPSQLLGPVESKEMVFKFLVALHGSKKMYRRQVVAVMAVLMHEKLWLKSLLQIEGFPENLSEDLRLIVEEEQKTMENEPEEPELPAEEASTARRSSRLDRSVQQLAAARFQLQQIGFCASDTDAAGEAFTVFNRAVLWIVQSPEQEDDEVLSKMEEKESVLEFLADFHDRRPKHRARITQLCVRLLEFETWREALASSNPSVAATLHALTGLSAPVRASTAVNLETAAELAASRGCIGALYLRIVSAKALPKDGAAPFVRARLGGASGAGAAAQRTETAAGVAPRWDGTPFVFEVPNPDASITMEVLSSDETGDDLLGSASFKVLEKAPESSKMPKLISLSLSAGGSLDFEILFRAAKSGGYAPRGTQSVVAGLTAALWDLENAKVEDGWIVSGVKGGASGVGGLACPAGHPIDKRKEGMSWRQSFLQGETKLCNFCRSEIQRHETRWRCFHHCDFNVCEKCYREKAAQ